MSENQEYDQLIAKLASYYGIHSSYVDVEKKTHQISTDTLKFILTAFGVPCDSLNEITTNIHYAETIRYQEHIEPVNVVWEDEEPAISVYFAKNALSKKMHCHLVLENGITKNWVVDIISLPVIEKKIISKQIYFTVKLLFPDPLPWGYHQLSICVDDKTVNSLVISAPQKAYNIKLNQPCFGFFSPIYALHSNQSLGCGDLRDFKDFITWADTKQAHITATLPIYANLLTEQYDPSPYSPISRLFFNEIYLDLSAMDEYDSTIKYQIDNTSEYVDYAQVIHLKKSLIKNMLVNLRKSPTRFNDLLKYVEGQPELQNYAKFMAYREKNSPSSMTLISDLSQFDLNDETFLYHLYVQWHLHLQLKDIFQHANHLHMAIYFDFPLGVSANSYDASAYPNDFVKAVSVGACPDPGFPEGQNWHLSPLHPINIRKSQYQYFIKALRTIMQYVHMLRLDHVMGLERLFWIPHGAKGNEGTYVSYKMDELFAILNLESHRNQVTLVGENLGTVSNTIKKALKQHSINEMYILEYELESGHKITPNNIRENCLVSLNTHDMPTFSAYLSGKDILEKSQGLEAKVISSLQKERANRIKHLKQTLSLPKPNEPVTEKIILQKSLQMLSASRAKYLLINMEDLWLESKQQNIPNNKEPYPNWSHRLKYSLEQLQKQKSLDNIIEGFSVYRANSNPNQMHFIRKPTESELNFKKVNKKTQLLPSLLTDDDIYLFNGGNHFQLYNKLGAHPVEHQNTKGVFFAVWAPNAKYVAVIGDFNKWNKHKNPMQSFKSSGLWITFIPDLKKGDLYKYFIHSHYNNFEIEKSDPISFYNEIPPKTASCVWEFTHEWRDQAWMAKRRQQQSLQSPISVYEIHFGSWRRIPEENNRFLTYREAAPLIADYVKKMGFTHVEFLPMMEHPYYNSWGYQTTGYFAPTSRFGTPDDFMYLIDYLHQQEIGVILDWVPSHFPVDGHGLALFDGTYLYEHSDPRKGFHPDWKSAIFNYGREEVRSFLISSALYWLDKFHVDGLRVDAVASMLYLDYSRKKDEWIPNQYGGRENIDAINFLKKLNEVIYQYFPDVHTFAEESTAWSGVSRPTYLGGLGFGLKWDMGWMHDTLQYFSHDPIHRKYHHNEITFRMIYAFTENFLLPLSHDEVVHGKKSILSKMPGYDKDKFANVKILYGYMFSQPGKKLLFMGNEFGQWTEWNNNTSLDWHLLQYQTHASLAEWVKTLNNLYQNHPALYQLDHDANGFEWIDCNDSQQSVLAYSRKSMEDDIILIVLNCTPIKRENYRLGVPRAGKWRLIANSDDLQFGGNMQKLNVFLDSEKITSHAREDSLNLMLPPLTILFYEWQKS